MQHGTPPASRGGGRGRVKRANVELSEESLGEATSLDRVHAGMLLQAGDAEGVLSLKGVSVSGFRLVRVPGSGMTPTAGKPRRISARNSLD